MPAKEPMAMNEAMKHLKRMVGSFRRYEQAGDLTGQSILMRAIRGTGKAPMIKSVLQADR